MMKALPIEQDPLVLAIIETELKQDIGPGDATTQALVPETAEATGFIVAREPCIASGIAVAAEAFRRADSRLQCTMLVSDGDHVSQGQDLLSVSGPARSILSAERTVLNICQRMSGIATTTEEYVRKAGNASVQILDTRKTTPGLRKLEKYAVACGKGINHRMGLHDQVMIKDNHLAFWKQAAGEDASIAEAVRTTRETFPHLEIEVEVDTVEQFKDAVAGEPDWILLDNMSPADMATCASLAGGKVKLEASGGITLENIEAVAATGVDAISVGALTHSVKAVDLSLELR